MTIFYSFLCAIYSCVWSCNNIKSETKIFIGSLAKITLLHTQINKSKREIGFHKMSTNSNFVLTHFIDYQNQMRIWPCFTIIKIRYRKKIKTELSNCTKIAIISKNFKKSRKIVLTRNIFHGKTNQLASFHYRLCALSPKEED